MLAVQISLFICTARHTNRHFVLRLIIGSDRRSQTKQGKIVRFRSCLRHFRFIISCRRHFVRFIL